VDCPVRIVSIRKDPPNSLIYHFHVPPPVQDGLDLLNYIVPKGYVCLDGTSLTVIDVDWEKRLFSVMLIAYTQSKVVMTSKDVGDLVNLEVDQMGKYVENTVRAMLSSGSGPVQTLIENAVKKILSERKD
jgi:riboflavin synthase